MTKPNFQIIYLEDADEFLLSVPIEARYKILYNIDKVLVGIIDNELFKKITNNIWEFRTKYNGMYYRLFAFYDKTTSSLIIATNGIIKKSDKTPKKDIEKAEMIRIKYLNNKQ
jgi:phage-related protein